MTSPHLETPRDYSQEEERPETKSKREQERDYASCADAIRTMAHACNESGDFCSAAFDPRHKGSVSNFSFSFVCSSASPSDDDDGVAELRHDLICQLRNELPVDRSCLLGNNLYREALMVRSIPRCSSRSFSSNSLTSTAPLLVDNDFFRGRGDVRAHS